MANVATKSPARKEPEVMAYTIRRDGNNFRVVKYLIQGEAVLARDESDLDSRIAQMTRIELEFRRME